MKKRIALLLALLLALCGCGTPTDNAQSSNTITDGSGAILDIPDKPEEITIATVYAVSVPFIVALGQSEKVLAVNTKSIFWTEADPNLADAGSVGRGTVDMEALASYAPTVLIHRSNDATTVTAVQDKLGIDVLCITVEDLDDIKDTLAMMGQYFGCPERAEEVSAWLDSKFAMIESIVKDIPDTERPTALVLGGEKGRVAGGDMLQSWLIEQAGGKCVAAGTEDNRNWVTVGEETIFSWNPDYIFCTSSTGLDYTVEGLLQDQAWAGLQAVKDRNIHQIPAKIDTWDMPGISCPLAAMYMLHKMHPDHFTAEQLQAEIDEYYSFMFGHTFESDYLGYSLEAGE